MELTRTANAGVLLRLDGVSVLLDGVCESLPPYLGTPDAVRASLTVDFPDVVAFTHQHPDHYDPTYAEEYATNTLRPVYGPEWTLFEANGLRFRAIPTRHIGKADVPHVSFVVSGSRTVWFVGDASPLVWRDVADLPRPDVLIVPYAYAITDAAWKATCALGARDVVLLHLPPRDDDPYGLWNAVETTVGSCDRLHIPLMGETLVL